MPGLEGNGSLPLGLRHVTSGLTANKLGSVLCPTLVIERGTTLLYLGSDREAEECTSLWNLGVWESHTKAHYQTVVEQKCELAN